MKKTFIIASMALFALFANAQTTQTTTKDLGDDVQVTYSYYLNNKGEEVFHGKMTVTEAPVNNNARKGKKTVTCNYQHGKLTGSFAYSCNMQHFEKYIDKTKGVDYNVSTGNFEVNTMWKKVREQKESFTVEMYENYLSGDIDISLSACRPDYQLLTLVGKAEKGVLVDGSMFELKQDGKTMENYQNNAQNRDNSICVDYKAGNKYGAGQYIDNPDGVKIEFGFNACRCSFVLKYPRYTMPVVPLNDAISSHSEYLKQMGVTEQKDILNDLYLRVQKHEIYITTEDSIKLGNMCDAIQNSIEREKQIRDSLSIELKNISATYAMLKNDVQKQLKGNRTLYHRNCKEEKSSYRDSYGMLKEKITLVPTFLPKEVEDLLYDKYNQRLETLSNEIKTTLLSNSIDASWSSKAPSNNEIENKIKLYEEQVELYSNSTAYQEFYNLIGGNEILNRTIQKASNIELLYTEQKTTATNIKNVSRENTTIKVKNKKNIYNDYLIVAAYLSEKANNVSAEGFIELVNQFDKVCDKMILVADNKSNDLEKALKNASTPEEKLNLLLK